jgi:phenylpropionate dioxygenase-like ring-hydroxylating dioxygenase large terminal subunit
MSQAPAPEMFPRFPQSWYFFCASNELNRRPLSRDVLGRRLVAYRASSGQVILMQARCCHLGADLGKGKLVGDHIQCPFHHWEYGPDGRCMHIPAQHHIPSFARQTCFPVVERHGFVFFFNAGEPLFPLPFFPDCRPEDFRAARPFQYTLACPWFMIGANAFDLQHFHAAHDRRLDGPTSVQNPGPFCRQATTTSVVAGSSLCDWLTRLCAGPRVTMTITDWCGNLIFTTARFRRTTSYGMVITEPLAEGGVTARVMVFQPRGKTALGRWCRDPLWLAIRRYFIRRFVNADALLLSEARYQPLSLIDCDRDLASYWCWLAEVSHGNPWDAAREQAQAARAG